ncbi:MAG: diaminohydroxyphosphoribosylaminopyrimidine deaminase [Halieaceae bacterium]|jgi:diaminohydroxyphosphoribosylaminopyrimidine deaminase/5-amino-6-(5-phosphoribosylamino)uracil reductase
MISPTEMNYMARALELARRGEGTTTPNPSVGCVLVKDGRIIGEGHTQPGGVPHGEADALAKLSESAAGATAYVTLEPCAHQGKSPPCSQALIDAKVARVVIATRDPNPLVAGRGVALLQEAGIAVSEGLLEAEARAVNAGFMQRMETGKPKVVAKLAMSLDGKTAMASGESQWITGPEARADVQKLRARSCAIVTGVGSVLDDDPALTVRLEDYQGSQPLRVILDSKLRTPATAKILQPPGASLIFTAVASQSPDYAAKRSTLNDAGAEVMVLADDNGRVDLAAALAALGERGCNEVLVECGSRLAGAFLRAGLIDELVVYMAPSLLGSNARGLIELPLDAMTDKIELEPIDTRVVGRDWRFTLKPAVTKSGR